jgi:Ca2+-binding RTX toxin-like protein
VTVFIYGNNLSNTRAAPSWTYQDYVIYGYGGNDVLSGANGNDDLVGGSGDDNLFGNAGSDWLEGGTGDDYLNGGTGSDFLFGGIGNDDIYGGKGSDEMTGDEGADYFIFSSLNDSNSFYGRDTITDFYRSEGDKIDLSDIDAKSGSSGNNAFDKWAGLDSTFNGNQGELHYFHLNGDTVVEADTNGDRVADIQIYLDGYLSLNQSDFII